MPNPLRLYVALAHDTNPESPLPLKPFSLSGGILEICSECYGQWLAAITTWFELAAHHIETERVETVQ